MKICMNRYSTDRNRGPARDNHPGLRQGMHLWRHARIPDIAKICSWRVAQPSNVYLVRSAHNVYLQLIVKM